MGDDKEKKMSQRELDEALWKAAREGKLDDVKKFKEQGGDPNWMHPWEPEGRGSQFTALHIASDNGHVATAKWLVEKGGIDINKKCAYGESALQHLGGLKGEGRAEIASYLKMKTAMNAALAAQRFKAKMGNKAAA